MAKSNKRGKAEKAKKVESKSKTKPKSTSAKKEVSKVKKAVSSKPAIKKKATPVPKAKSSKVSTPKKVVVKAKEVAKSTKKSNSRPAVAKKKESVKVTSAGTKSIKAVTKTTVSRNLQEKKIVSSKETKKTNEKYELGVVLRTGRRPQAILNKQNKEIDDMGEEKLRYSEEELKEFAELITEKLDKAKKELNYMKEMLSKKNDEGTDNTAGTMKLLEDGADTLEKENFSQLAVRQQKYATQLENALARIKNGTYGVCIDTGKLIPKERLKAVPHTQHSIEAKLNRRD